MRRGSVNSQPAKAGGRRRQTLGSAARQLTLVLASLAVASCSLLQGSPPITGINVIAVMPIERVEPSSATPQEGVPQLAPGAERVVTAQVYEVLASSPQWRFVPDLAVVAALSHINPREDIESRARALGKAVNADGVLYGTVSRYVERVGSEYGARQPAAVSFSLQLLSVASGEVVWKGSFDQMQQPLSSNLLNWWQFWRGGPRWFSAQEFTRLGVESLLEELSKRLGY